MPNVKPAFPEFGTATPAMGSPDWVAPTGTQETDGFDGTAGELTRGLVNWLKVQTYKALVWLEDTRLAWSALDADESDGGGWAITSSIVAPSTGAGLTGTSGALEAEFDGRHVVLTSAAKVYTASRDTYVDIDNEGTLTYTEVANGAGAPALAAGDFRCFKVVTDGADRTAATTLAVQTPRITQQLSARGGIKFGAGLVTDGTPRDIGGSGTPFGVAYLTGLDVQGNGVQDDLTPDLDDTHSLGTTALAYAEVNSKDFIAHTGGTGYTYEAAVAISRSVAASAFTGEIDYGVSDLPMWALLAASSDPTNAAQYFVRSGVSAATATVCKAPLPTFHDGTIITAARVLADVTAGTVYAAIIRTPLAGVGAAGNLSTTGATTGEALGGGASVTSLSMDASSATRTIDNTAYTYEVWIRAAANATVRLYGVEIEATQTSLNG